VETVNTHAASTAAGPAEMIRSALHNRSLIGRMVWREVIGRYRGSLVGLAWSFITPLMMLAVYTFVFSTIFQIRWQVEHTGRIDFAVVLFTGLIVHGLVAECINRAPALILSNVNFVKRVLFPLEVLPVVALGSALFHACVNVAVIVAVLVVLYGSIPTTAILLPVVLLPLLLGTLGVAWLLSSLGVFVRDVAQMTGTITMALLFLSPVFYPITAVPEEFRVIMSVNPLTYIIEECRSVLLWGELPEWRVWSGYMAAGSLTACVGFWWFQRTRRAFADVL
jgi:lipopolysaccharide transport system permease protein